LGQRRRKVNNFPRSSGVVYPVATGLLTGSDGKRLSTIKKNIITKLWDTSLGR
jgi:hypothetical protein